MRYMTSAEIRKVWLSFFAKKGHKIEPSAPLIPINDNTLLWINAGVTPLKKYFDGRETPPAPRLTNIQKCIRTNDIENVGETSRHHTFFEMVGNFSIGDYFKKEALEFAYEILFSDEYFGFPKDKIYITYYPDDLECKEIWLKLGIEESHIIPKDDNFWEIGEGPCGPDTEIHFDRGIEFGDLPPSILEYDEENDRYIELWNIVFSQYNAKPGLSRSEYPELPSKNIDTGGGFERFACILQNAKTNFETDLFLPIMNEIAHITNTKYDGQKSFKVIADHIKTLVFSISDGAVLSNEGRGYVLRRLLRRAVKHGYKLGVKKPFLHSLVDTVVKMMSDFYPYLIDNKEIVAEIIKKEEIKFLQTIDAGEKQIEQFIHNNIKSIDGITAFKLYDTYGFPIELTVEYANEAGISVDVDGFNAELEIQKSRSRNARTDLGSMNNQNAAFMEYTSNSRFIGYDRLTAKTKVIKVFDEGIVLEETPFYAFSGGQMADKGTINGIEVLDVIKLPHGQHLHVVDYRFKENEDVEAIVNAETRISIARNHSATHLLQKALKDVLGNHVNQQGSLVTDKFLRFDFNNYSLISDTEIQIIEDRVNNRILKNLDVNIKTMPIDEAKKLGAMALFSEKYGEEVRVVDMGYSIELCGGTHVCNTKDIVDFAIVGLESIGSGMYRIEAITGFDLKEKIKPFLPAQLKEVEAVFAKNNINNVIIEKPKLIGSYLDIMNYHEYIDDLKKQNKENEKLIKENKAKEALSDLNKYISNPNDKRIIIETTDLEIPILKQLVDAIYDKIKAEVIFAINQDSEKASFVCKSKLNNALELIKLAASLSNGNGGGKENLAQGGTKNLDKVSLIRKEILKKL